MLSPYIGQPLDKWSLGTCPRCADYGPFFDTEEACTRCMDDERARACGAFRALAELGHAVTVGVLACFAAVETQCDDGDPWPARLPRSQRFSVEAVLRAALGDS